MVHQKLYTKEMFLIAAEKCEVSMIDAKHIMKYIDEYVTPIELPSDEEVYFESRRYEKYHESMNELESECSAARYHGHMQGAKYVINKILNK